MKYGKMTLGQIEVPINKLGGEKGALCFLREKLKLVEASPLEFTVWKTVTLGLHKSPDAYRHALKSVNQKIGSWGGDILSRIICSQEETGVDLVMRSVGDLGFKTGARYEDICAKAQEFGLEPCPAEVGPALRLQYGDQPLNEGLLIAMETIVDRDDDRGIFSVGHDDDGLWLNGSVGPRGSVWRADHRFVFVPRK